VAGKAASRLIESSAREPPPSIRITDQGLHVCAATIRSGVVDALNHCTEDEHLRAPALAFTFARHPVGDRGWGMRMRAVGQTKYSL